MNIDNREIEVKFKISSTEEMLDIILKAGAVLEQETRFEKNLRWDDAEETLTKTHQVLRLRDNSGTSVLTYKSEKQNNKGKKQHFFILLPANHHSIDSWPPTTIGHERSDGT